MASKKYLVSIDLNKNELQNAKLQNLATTPATVVTSQNLGVNDAGYTYWSTTDNTAYFWTGTVWKSLEASAGIPTKTSQLTNDGEFTTGKYTEVLNQNVTSMFALGNIKISDVISTGMTFTDFVKDLLLTVFTPTYSNPTFDLSSNLYGVLQEVGTTPSITLTYTYNRGSIKGSGLNASWNPVTSQNPRGGAATNYTLNGVSNGTTTTYTFTPSALTSGANTFSGSVTYATGPQPIDSSGANYQATLTGGTQSASTTITAVYPIFYVVSTTAITASSFATAINTGTIAGGTVTTLVADSTGTITLPFTPSSQYFAFGYPATSTTKTVYYVTALDNGNISGVLPLVSTQNASHSSAWSNVSYKLHVSPILNNPGAGSIQLKNS